MKVIDANTGLELKEGTVFDNVMGRVHVHQIVPGLRTARALISVNMRPPRWVPLHVRWTHPSFFLQHVAFLPS